MPRNTTLAKCKHMYIVSEDLKVWPFCWMCSNLFPWNYSPLALLYKFEMRWDCLWLASSCITQSCIKHCPFGIAFAWNMVLCYALWKTTLHVIKCPSSSLTPITQLNISFMLEKEAILYRIYVAYNYKTNILYYILNRQNFEILLANYTS